MGLETMFEELETIECFFYNATRRRNNLRNSTNPIDHDDPIFAPDAKGAVRGRNCDLFIRAAALDGGSPYPVRERTSS